MLLALPTVAVAGGVMGDPGDSGDSDEPTLSGGEQDRSDWKDLPVLGKSDNGTFTSAGGGNGALAWLAAHTSAGKTTAVNSNGTEGSTTWWAKFKLKFGRGSE